MMICLNVLFYPVHVKLHVRVYPRTFYLRTSLAVRDDANYVPPVFKIIHDWRARIACARILLSVKVSSAKLRTRVSLHEVSNQTAA